MLRGLVLGILKRFFGVFHLLEIEGREHVPSTGPVIIACNHVNYFDPFIIQLGVSRPVRFVAWVRGFKHVFGWFMRQMGAIPIDLAKPDRRAYEAALNVLRRGEALGIFPEGMFTPTGHVVPPKVGAARMALETGAVICPASLTGAFRVWAPHVEGAGRFWGRVFPRPGKMTLKFHPPVVLDEQERVARAHDKEYHRQIIERVMEPVIRRVEPSLRAEERIEELVQGPASPIRIYEWLPLIAIGVGAWLARERGIDGAGPLAARALMAYGLYAAYLVADIFWIRQNWRAKFVRNAAAPILLLVAMFPTLFELVARLRLAVWQPPADLGLGAWPFRGVAGAALSDWWTVTYLFPFVYIASSLWAYYFSHFLQFQRLVRGLLLAFYAGLLLVILVPPLGIAHPVVPEASQWGPMSRLLYARAPASGWRFAQFPGFFVLICVYLWLFDRGHGLSARARWAAPWVLNSVLAALLLRGLCVPHALAFAAVGWVVHSYVSAVKFVAHHGKWV